jgi:flavin reductase (DIM6/NTAB) family NADH-FMN oxidoreductase RutF
MIGEIIHAGLGADAFVLVTSAFGKTRNIMTMGRHTVMEFTPSLVGCVIAARNHSFGLVRGSSECVINLPTTKLTDQVVGVGNASGAEIDKFATFALTPQKAQCVGTPLIRECHANFECKLADDRLVGEYSFFIFEVVKAHVASAQHHHLSRRLHRSKISGLLGTCAS